MIGNAVKYVPKASKVSKASNYLINNARKPPKKILRFKLTFNKPLVIKLPNFQKMSELKAMSQKQTYQNYHKSLTVSFDILSKTPSDLAKIVYTAEQTPMDCSKHELPNGLEEYQLGLLFNIQELEGDPILNICEHK